MIDEFNGNITEMLLDEFASRKGHSMVHELFLDKKTGHQDKDTRFRTSILSNFPVPTRICYFSVNISMCNNRLQSSLKSIVLMSSIFGTLLQFDITQIVVEQTNLKNEFLVFLTRFTKLVVCEDNVVCDDLREIFKMYHIDELMLSFPHYKEKEESKERFRLECNFTEL